MVMEESKALDVINDFQSPLVNAWEDLVFDRITFRLTLVRPVIARGSRTDYNGGMISRVFLVFCRVADFKITLGAVE